MNDIKRFEKRVQKLQTQLARAEEFLALMKKYPEEATVIEAYYDHSEYDIDEVVEICDLCD